MADMLVKLYTLPPLAPHRARLAKQAIEIRRAHATEQDLVTDWTRQHFSETWGRECRVAIQRYPASCYLAVEKRRPPAEGNPYAQPPELLLGFACYNVAALGLFGPTGVREDYRGRGIGTALLLAALHAMKAEGYAYAAIGWAGPTGFYAKTVGAIPIEGSEPGVYRGPLTAHRDQD